MVWLSEEMDLGKGLTQSLDHTSYMGAMSKANQGLHSFGTSSGIYSPPCRDIPSQNTVAATSYFSSRFGPSGQGIHPYETSLTLPEPCATTTVESDYSQPSTGYTESPHGTMVSSFQQQPGQQQMIFNPGSIHFASQHDYNQWQYGGNPASAYGYGYTSQGMPVPGFSYPVGMNGAGK